MQPGATLILIAPLPSPRRPRYPPGHPLAWLEEAGDSEGEELPEERRRELLQLGFPDDGYDYLRHMRTLGRGGASLEGLAGSQPAGEASAGKPGGRGRVRRSGGVCAARRFAPCSLVSACPSS